jgi:hypothetical protein
MRFGQQLALGVGGGALAVAGFVVLSGGDRVVAVILALVGASALSGWVRARRGEIS